MPASLRQRPVRSGYLPTVAAAAALFSIQNIGSASGPVVRCCGELDLACASELETAVRQVLDGNPAAVTLDVRNVGFIDSTGLRALLNADRDARRRGVPMTVLVTEEPVGRVLRITALEDVLPLRRH